MSGLQEKFQVILPPQPNEDDGTEWVTFESVRDPSRNNPSVEMPKLDLQNKNRMERHIAGSTDFSYDTNPKALETGYTRQEMKGADDQYTGEHVEHFYGEVVDELGNAGFVERNNYLDRA
jgi:hypothetical protein